MDPNATLDQIVTAYREQDWNALQEHAHALNVWLHTEGFMPNVTREHLQILCRATARFASDPRD